MGVADPPVRTASFGPDLALLGQAFSASRAAEAVVGEERGLEGRAWWGGAWRRSGDGGEERGGWVREGEEGRKGKSVDGVQEERAQKRKAKREGQTSGETGFRGEGRGVAEGVKKLVV